MFFPNMQGFSTEIVDVEFPGQGRLMARVIVPSGKNQYGPYPVPDPHKAPLMRTKTPGAAETGSGTSLVSAALQRIGIQHEKRTGRWAQRKSAHFDLTGARHFMCIRRQNGYCAALDSFSEYASRGFAV